MSLRVSRATALLPLLCLALNAAPALAQSTPTTDAARDALAKKEDDVDQAKLLKETLSASDKQYSLLKKGKSSATYDLSYSYIGQQTIDVSFDDSGAISNFALTNTRGHTVTNTLSADYGVMDNLTANVTLPLVSRYSQTETFSGLTNAFGDLSLGVRYQPFALRRDLPSLTTTAALRLPTGRSPFKTIQSQGLGTGSGYAGITLGVNTSKIIDPVAIFGSFNVGFGAPATGLEQKRGTRTLTEVRPGPSVGFGAGFAYALSYNISTSLSFQEQVSGRSKLKLLNADGTVTNTRTSSQTSASMTLGLGVRVSPQTTINFSVGIGMSSDTPDFTLGMNLPLQF